MAFPLPKKKPLPLPVKKHVEEEVQTYINSADTPQEDPAAGLDKAEKLTVDFNLKMNRWERAWLGWIAKREDRSMRYMARKFLRYAIEAEVAKWKESKNVA